MNFELSATAAFTGHRNYRDQATAELDAAVAALCDRGISIFLSGMALGFDMAAAESVLRIRALRPDARIRLVAAVPFPEQADRFPEPERERYRRILAAADAIATVAPAYIPQCYAMRNAFLVDNASVIVAWYDGSKGGTHSTLQRARRLRREIINLRPDPHGSIGF